MEIPRVPEIDPLAALMVNPVVRVEAILLELRPSGRSFDRRPSGRVRRHLPQLRQRLRSRLSSTSETRVADQYEIKGCVAHGGLGWVYLAEDHNVNERPVVLKGLVHAGDAGGTGDRDGRTAVPRRGGPSPIVKIYNLSSTRTPGEPVGYIVMEYVGGTSLKPEKGQRLPVAEAIAYMLEILPAMSYLHSIGLCYNDLKPENIMVTEERRRSNHRPGAVSGSIRLIPLRHTGLPGAGDRADRADGGNRHLYRWPDAGGAHVAPSHPQRPIRRRTARDDLVLVKNSIARLLRRAIDPTRSDAGSADEMSAQLLGCSAKWSQATPVYPGRPLDGVHPHPFDVRGRPSSPTPTSTSTALCTPSG